ncbi:MULTISPECIES: QcrA and Rieske domain-containing protein [unclassified Cellulophaga]|uniref:QcrA and Rieske domain-containing protein n=1 Tax=unclassified Cellulophaga TaxID=2634405 RepID=UPI0026E3D2BB|nr:MULTISPECIES: Rieske 2Fe-2S domain-containing protein [unclassified Cellulophaga]MDO6493023.1 Rieske 2Fe-2S domain-containing protein [Cellulophaga sp. 2_MG-2023]MDO6495999.1 Rieske 2Fe-2S domain-containing protein [Cellulophaga sp. 3_MG-2023]
MERKQFLRTLGAGAAFALTFPCLGGCSSDSDSEEGDKKEVPTNVDFTIDLESSEASNLQNNGGFILKNDVVVVKNLEGEFVAATQICSHENYDQVRFADVDGGIFYCDVHGSRFSQTGEPLNQVDSKAAKPLKVYQITLTGTMLRVFE